MIVGAPLGALPQLPKTAKQLSPFRSRNGAEGADTQSEAVNQMLLASHELVRQQKYIDALAKLSEIEALPNKTADQMLLVQQTRIAIAAVTNNDALLASAIEAALASGKVPQATRIQYCQALGNLYYRAKNYPQAVSWLSRYFQEGGQDQSIREFLLLSYYFNGEYAQAVEGVRTDIRNAESAGQAPSEAQLRLLASCALKIKSRAEYINAVEKFVAYYPKKEYWTDLLTNILSKPAFPEYLALDVYRLMDATQQLSTAKDYMEMAQLALASGYPAEAQKVLDEGFRLRVLGSGEDAGKHKQLRDAATRATAAENRTLGEREKSAAEARQGESLVDVGFAYADRGQYDKGVALMEAGLRAGGLKRSEEAKLHLGVAYMMANQKEKAIAAFRQLQGNSSAADIAKYWILFLNSPLASPT